MPETEPLNAAAARINLRRFGEYKNIFGAEKMRFLWNEYLVQSAKSWQNVAAMDWVACRTAFHNWRSSSQVFGMDDFAQACLVIEERILSRRFAGLEKMVAESRGLYEQSINDVAAIFLQMEEDNEETGCKR